MDPRVPCVLTCEANGCKLGNPLFSVAKSSCSCTPPTATCLGLYLSWFCVFCIPRRWILFWWRFIQLFRQFLEQHKIYHHPPLETTRSFSGRHFFRGTCGVSFCFRRPAWQRRWCVRLSLRFRKEQVEGCQGSDMFWLMTSDTDMWEHVRLESCQGSNMFTFKNWVMNLLNFFSDE